MLKQYLEKIVYDEMAARLPADRFQAALLSELTKNFSKTDKGKDRINFNTTDISLITKGIFEAIRNLAAPAKVVLANISVSETDRSQAGAFINKFSRTFSNYLITLTKTLTIGDEEFPAGTTTYLINNYTEDKVTGTGSTMNGNSLKPDVLNIAGFDIESYDQFKKILIKNLNQYDENVKVFCKGLIDDMGKNIKPFPRIKNKIDFKGAGKDTKIKLSAKTMAAYEILPDFDIGVIGKNFGEALGGLLFFKKFNANKVFYPVAGNYPLSDFNVDDIIAISSKYKTGAPASLLNIANKLKELDAKDKDQVQVDKEVAAVLIMMAEHSAPAGYWYAAQKLKPSIYKLIEENIDIKNSNNKKLANIETTVVNVQKDISDFIEKKYQGFLNQGEEIAIEKTTAYLKETFWDKVGARPTAKTVKNVLTANSNKSGLLLAPMTSEIIAKLNTSKKYIEGLNTIAQTLGVKQLYLEFKLPGKRAKEGTDSYMTFLLKDFGSGNFIYALKSGGVDSWARAKITFSMV